MSTWWRSITRTAIETATMSFRASVLAVLFGLNLYGNEIRLRRREKR